MAMVESVVTPTTVRMRLRSLCWSRGITAERARAAEAPQMATAPPVSSPRSRSRPSRRASSRPTSDGQRDARDHREHRPEAQLEHLRRRDARAEQSHAQAQNSAGRELDPRDATPFLGQEVERHAQEQGVENRRPAVIVGQEGRRQADGQADQKARQPLGEPVVARPQQCRWQRCPELVGCHHLSPGPGLAVAGTNQRAEAKPVGGWRRPTTAGRAGIRHVRRSPCTCRAGAPAWPARRGGTGRPARACTSSR